MMIWRLLASVLGDPRQPQKTKRERAMNDRSKADTSRICRSANRLTNRDDVLVWLSLAWFVALCGAAIWVLFFCCKLHFRVALLAMLLMRQPWLNSRLN